MTSESQGSDKLKSILDQARAQAAAQQNSPAEAHEAEVTDLVNKDAALPDPLALARLYQSSDLRAKLPEEASRPAATQSPGWQELPAPAARASAAVPLPAGDPGHEAGTPTHPGLTPAEMRAVMAHLQEKFSVSERSYETYELSSRPVDDLPVTDPAESGLEMAEAIAAVEAAGGGLALYLLGAALVLAVVVAFILLAVNGVGPFKPVPNISPSVGAAPSP